MFRIAWQDESLEVVHVNDVMHAPVCGHDEEDAATMAAHTYVEWLEAVGDNDA